MTLHDALGRAIGWRISRRWRWAARRRWLERWARMVAPRVDYDRHSGQRLGLDCPECDGGMLLWGEHAMPSLSMIFHNRVVCTSCSFRVWINGER